MREELGVCATTEIEHHVFERLMITGDTRHVLSLVIVSGATLSGSLPIIFPALVTSGETAGQSNEDDSPEE